MTLPPSITTTVPVAALPQLTIQKTVSRATAAPGDTVNYEVVVRNPSTVAATPVTIIDQLPGGFSYVASTVASVPAPANPPAINTANRTLTLTYGTLAPGGEIRVTYEVQIAANAPDGSGINTAEASAPGVPPVTATAEVVVSRTPIPELSIEKTTARATAAPGDTVGYTVVVRNVSTVVANPVTITDQLPGGFSYVASTVASVPAPTNPPAINTANRTLALTYGALNPGDEIRVTYNVRIAADAPDGNGVNTAEASTPGAPTVTANATVLISRTPIPELSIEKTVARPTVAPGDTVNYEVIVQNVSTVVANPVTVVDQLPVGFSYVANSIESVPATTAPPAIDAANRTLTLTYGALNPGDEIRVTYNVRIAADAPDGNGVNTAEALTPGAPIVVARATVTVTRAAPALAIVKTSNRTAAAPEDVVNYQVEVTNISTVTLDPVRVVDQLPVGFSYVANSIQSVPPALTQTLDPANRTLTLTYNPLAAGAVIDLTYDVRIAPGATAGNGVNTVQAEVPGVVPPVVDNVRVTLVPPPSPPPQLRIEKTANRTAAAPGDVVDYQVVVRNPSNVAATPVTVSDQLPVGFAYIPNSVQATPNAPTAVEINGRTLTLTFATLPAGEALTVTYSAQVTPEAANGDGINRAQASTPGVPPVGARVPVTVVPPPFPPPQLEIEKTAARTVAPPGGLVGYQVVVTNTSTVAATPLTIIDQLPDGFAYVASSVQATPNAPTQVEILGRTLTLTFATLPGEEALTVTYNVRIAADAPEADGVNEVQATTPGLPPVRDRAQVTVNPSPPELAIEKTVVQSEATPGDLVNYQVVVSNVSAVVAAPVTVTDQLPLGLAYLEDSIRATSDIRDQTVNAADRTLILTFDTLPPDGAITINYAVRVTADAVGGDGVNRVEASAPGTNTVSANARITINAPTPELRIIKTSDRAAAEPGDVVVYRLVVTNVSEAVANPVTITDQLPLGMTYVPDSIQAIPNPPTEVMNMGSALRLTFGELPPGQSITVAYAVLMTPDAVRGDGRNIAQAATPGAPTVTATYQMTIRPGILADCGTIVGRVFVDKNFDGQQQPGEPGVPNAVIFMDDGNRILTDADGLFSLINVLPGHRVGTLDLYSMPGYTLAPNLFRIEENSVSRMVRLSPGGMARMNFAVTPTFGEEQP
ncbi:isopeptide-forming domain-containing fimbrial protein [Leptolyngbya sp. BL0902]|uniref:DUF7927 domain-containing protein n=1 Tax=Leptolyngbya sp. BL0902 TaxID=1115757 RepID=UPI0018E8CF29|nr:isopeptide-forming domain-containing fimbrial protein [Leptolyngbya sp. BL0902]